MSTLKRLCLPASAVLLGVLLASCVPQAKVTENLETQRSQPSMKYVFAHKFLPWMIYRDPSIALRLAAADDRQEVLLAMWDVLSETSSGFIPEKPIGLTTETYTKGTSAILVLVSFPQPEEIPEAYHACIVLPYEILTRKAELQASDLRYFTLEKTLDLSGILDADTPPQAKPTILGGWTSEGDHFSYGRGPAPDEPKAFLGAVWEILDEAKQ